MTKKEEIILEFMKDPEYKPMKAKEIAITEAEKNLEEHIKENKLINKQINIEQSENDVEVEVIYEVLESIGTKEKIVF